MRGIFQVQPGYSVLASGYPVFCERFFRRFTPLMIMSKLIFISLAFTCLLSLSGAIRSEVPPPERMTIFDLERAFKADGSRGPYRISDRPVLRGSASVWVEDRVQVQGLDYRIDEDAALLIFFQDLPRGTPVLVRFRQSPQVLRPVYRRRERAAAGPEEAARSLPRAPAVRAEGGFQPPAPDGPRLDIGGTKRIQVGFGSDREPDLTQSLRVHISGEVAEGVEVLAMLSDRNLPLQPDGRTRSLQELDRVTFQVQSRSFSAGLGDQDVVFDETTFGRYRRRLQGARFAVSLPGGDARLFGAVSEGRWVSHRIAPAGGYQGPYRLAGGDGGGGGQVAAGSERIYLDGRLLRRGEGQDYAVDYERGLLTFTPARPISAESRIRVEYQLLDGRSRRRMMGFRGRLDLADDRFSLGTTFIRETDRAFAVPGLSGPASDAALQQVTVLDAAYTPLEGMRLSGEVALSDRSSTSLSADGRERSRDHAFQLGVDLAPTPLTVGGRGLGRVRLAGSYRRVGAGFFGFDRIDRGESEGRWGWRPEAERGDERSGEMAFYYIPRQGVRLHLGYGRRSGSHPAARREVGVAVSTPRAPDVRYLYEEISEGSGRLARQQGKLTTAVWKVRPGFRFASETAHGDAVGASSLFYASAPGRTGLPRGVQMRELAWDLSSGSRNTWSWTSAFILRRTRRLDGGWRDSLQSWSHRHRIGTSGWHGLSLSGEYSRSAVRAPQQAGGRRHTDLARLRLGYAPLDGALSQQISYRISSTGAPNRQPVFTYAGQGRGAYLWEDVDGDGLKDREEFVPDVDGDYELFYGGEGGFRPVREAALGARFEVVLKRLLRSPDGPWQRFLARVSLDLSLEADRRVLTEYGGAPPWRLYRFRTGSEVLSGRRDIRTVLYLFRYSRRASFRVSSRQRDRIDRTYSDGGMEGLSEGAVHGRFRFGPRFEVETDLSGGARSREGEGPFAYGIGWQAFSLRGRWRFVGGWQTGMGVGMGWDREKIRGLEAGRVSLKPELIRSLPGRGRIRSSLDWVRVSASERLPLFLGMAGGNRGGHNLVWRVGIDYRLARYITALLVYDGRRRPDRPVLHLGRMEMRATF